MMERLHYTALLISVIGNIDTLENNEKKQSNKNELNRNSGNLETTKLLIENGADVNAKGTDGCSALHVSSFNGN